MMAVFLIKLSTLFYSFYCDSNYKQMPFMTLKIVIFLFIVFEVNFIVWVYL